MGALRKLMPFTAGTFIIGWLAIAGVPPFSGFWSKDEILLYAYDKSPILWAVGLVTALLTAYYMTRQVVMVFFSEPRWKDAQEHDSAGADHADTADHSPATADAAADHGAHGAHGEPHESPPIMWIPLVALAGLALIGGGLNLPFSHKTKFLEQWLAPITEESERQLGVSTGLKWVLALIAVAGALIGISLAVAVYQRHRLKAVEPAVLANAWYVDAAYAAAVGGPGRETFDFITYEVDAKVVDGAVNGVATLVRETGGQGRKLQTGFVRNYAWGVAMGAALLLGWFVYRGVM
jgi:NADH-quinone oxidoreductase subunit L